MQHNSPITAFQQPRDQAGHLTTDHLRLLVVGAAAVAFLLATGCSQHKHQDLELCREVLITSLDAWKSGAVPGDLRQRQPRIVVGDNDWEQGRRLLNFQVAKNDVFDGGTCPRAGGADDAELLRQQSGHGRRDLRRLRVSRHHHFSRGIVVGHCHLHRGKASRMLHVTYFPMRISDEKNAAVERLVADRHRHYAGCSTGWISSQTRAENPSRNRPGAGSVEATPTSSTAASRGG